jgi:hypothetical protein
LWLTKAWWNVGSPIEIVKSGPWNQLRKEYEKDIFQSR